MEPQGPKLAEGRDSEIFEHGADRVLRLARDGRSLEREAEVMRYARASGYPVPEVYEAGDGYLVMDRVHGPTLIDDAIPFRLRQNAKVLARLHDDLHRIPAPDWLEREAPVAGDSLVHLDLHPLNVLVSADGPVVIDWSNAARGAPGSDLADVWLVVACGAPPTSRIEALLVPVVRKVFLSAFLGAVDEGAARAAMSAAVERRLGDRNLTAAERDRMTALAARVAAD